MAKGMWLGIGVFVILFVGIDSADAGGGSHHELIPQEGSAGQVLVGEVVDVFCYLSHGEEGLGKDHARCARRCIEQGLPVAIKIGDKLYLASMTHHEPANDTLAVYAGRQVEVHGEVMGRDGQYMVAISSIEAID